MSESLEERCYQTLRDNTIEAAGEHIYTAPDKTYYGHQWLWDSALAVHAWSIKHPERAAREISSLLKRGQWNDGMVPNTVINDSETDAFLWNSKRVSDAPRAWATSGITQPPLLAQATWETAKQLPDDERQAFLDDTLWRVAYYHDWLYRTRDFSDDGLVSVVHPYETGMDNNPALAEHMAQIDWRVPNVAIRALRRTVAMVRQDTKRFPAEERATLDATTYATLATLRMRHTGYNPARLANEPFRVQDVHFNSILARNNDILAEMADEAHAPLSDFLLDKFRQTRDNFELLWDDKEQMYFSRDDVTGDLLRTPTIASLMPLYAGDLPAGHEAALLQHLQDPESFGAPVGIPSTPLNSPQYRHPGYWDGSTWPFTNYLLTDGLARAGYTDLTASLDRTFLESVDTHGSREYFSPETGRGYGTSNFSPTASLALIALQRQTS